jgi:glycosyltransferase involved in cell wall biosynthesis
MRIAMLSPIAWRTPPRQYGPWENVVSLLTEGLVNRGIDVTLYATGDSITQGKLKATCSTGYEEDNKVIPKVAECLHISELFEHADDYDVIHNHFDFLPLSYSSMTTTPIIATIHGFSSPAILPVYEKYNKKVFYISISDADRASILDYLATVHHGINLNQFSLQTKPENYLVFMARIHPDKGAREAIAIALASGIKLIMAGIIQDQEYFKQYVEPQLIPGKIEFLGSVDPEQRNRLLGGAKALLHPIYFDEPFGLSVIESMACGTPVIAFNRGSMPELIINGHNGFLVDDIDQATTAVKHLKEIDRSHCRRHVEQFFSTEQMVDNYLKVYQQVIEKTARESHRPWGHYKILADSAHYKSKEILVFPGKRLSLQSHQRRAEHWLIIEGRGDVTVNHQISTLMPGQSADIPQGAMHRISNPSTNENLHFIEIQTGDYFGEDDITRYEDDFGRV